MDYFKMFVSGALIISIGLNFSLSSKLEALENQVNSLSNNQYQMLDSVNSQASHIENVMDEIKREQSWIGTIDMKVDSKEWEEGKAKISFEWQIKELPNNSTVVFNYNFEGEEYTTIPAEEKQNGLYQVTIPVEVKLEPDWEIGVIESSIEEEMSKKEIEEKRIEQYEQNQFNYFVSVTTNDLVKSSAIHTANLGKIGTSKYGIINTSIDLHENNYYVSVVQHVVGDDDHDSNFLKEVYLLKYNNGKLVEEENLMSDEQNLEQSRYGPFVFQMDQLEEMEYTSLVVKVVYSNGDTFENEVYRK